ncbi:MAG: hypothetical protein K6G24_04390, partial [Lachnospiraceae bacterium]|nr:hypothetical protein [Lachnospiraceae bacterium]
MKEMKRNLRILLLTFFLLLTSVSSVQAYAAEKDSEFAGKTTITPVGGYNIAGIADEGTCGISNYPVDPIQYEGFAGLRVATNGTKVNYTMYTHSNLYDKGTVKIQPLNMVKSVAADLGSIKVDETKSFDLKDMFAGDGKFIDAFAILNVHLSK